MTLVQQINDELEEFCSQCGEWVSPLHFNHQSGWCSSCTQEICDQPLCSHCGVVLTDNHRSTCHTCRQELWLARHSDELEFLIVVKGYSLNQARQTIAKLVRPICQSCGKPIKGAHENALFHKDKRACHKAYRMYKRLISRDGLTNQAALAIMKGSNQGR